MLWSDFLSPLLFLSAAVAAANAFGSYNPNPNRFSLYKSGPSPHYSSGKPTARHKNHCAYVVEKSVSYTVQDGVAPFVKAEYNKCTWSKKCPKLKYRMFYKPMYKVIHKTMTELEWRCCPGFTGVGCNAGPAAYGMKSMPPFKGSMPSQKGPMPSSKGPQPSMKGPMPPFKGPRPAYKGYTPSYKGPSIPYKGPMPSYKGPVRQPSYKGNPWDQPHIPTGPMGGGYLGYNMAPSYPETPFESNPDLQEPEMGHIDTFPEQHISLTDDQDPAPDPIPDDHEPITDYQDPSMPDHQSSTVQQPDAQPVPEAQAPSGDSETNPGSEEDSAAAERLNRMEEDVQRLSLGLETLRGKVTGLEDHLRTSLREDANRMLSALLSAVPAPATSQHSTVAFGDLPGAAPDIEGMEMVGQFPKLGELAEKVEELRTELLSKTTELAELRGTVLRHNGTLQRLTGGAANLTGNQQPLETLVEAKLGETRVAILEGFERRVESVEDRFMGRATEVRLQCKKELMDGQEHLQQVLNSSFADLRKEFMSFNGQLQGFEPGNQEVCCSAVSGLTERLVLVEDSMDGLNQSQLHLRAELGSHKDHVEGMIEGRLGYVEDKLNKAEMQLGDVGSETSVKLDACLEEKMKALENRLFAAVEELGNATAPALLEGQAVPTLETEVESLRKRVEVDVDRFQKQLSLLELLCTSSCAPQPVLTGFVAPLQTPEVELKGDHQNLNGQLDAQTERMDRLNATLNSLLFQLSEKKEETGIEGELTVLKVNVHSVNRTLCGLKDTFGQVMQEMEHANLTWQDREERLAQQVKGVVQLVGRQASMLGTGERRLTRLKGELQDLRRRLAAELQGCRSTALGVQKEVTEVGGRVSRVEGQCGGLARLAEDLELIRGELDKQSDGYLSQVNTTLINHSLQISELKNGLKNCTGSSGLAQSTDDHFSTTTRPWVEPHTAEPVYPRGDQFTDSTQLRDDQGFGQAP